jgi:hypothetical protein
MVLTAGWYENHDADQKCKNRLPEWIAVTNCCEGFAARNELLERISGDVLLERILRADRLKELVRKDCWNGLLEQIAGTDCNGWKCSGAPAEGQTCGMVWTGLKRN